MIPSVNFTDRKKLMELINQAPGNYFGLKGSSGMKIRTAYYKDKRQQFFDKINDWMNSDLAGEGIYQVVNGSNKSTEPIFLIQKGNLSVGSPPIIIQEKDSSDINLVKENAELKARLHYLELQLAELQEDLEEADELSDAPKPEEKPNPWHQLAEQLIPVAGSILGAIASKYLNGTQQPNGAGQTQPGAVEMRYPRGYAPPNSEQIPGNGSGNPNNIQSYDYPGDDLRYGNFETQAQN